MYQSASKSAKKQTLVIGKPSNSNLSRRVQTETNDYDEVEQDIQTFQDISNFKHRNKFISFNKPAKKPTMKDFNAQYQQCLKNENQMRPISEAVKKCQKPQGLDKINTKSLLIPAKITRQDYSSYTYQNLKAIGSGSFGTVYKSKVIETGEIVAIKKVLQDKRYKNRELQILQELNHHNVVKLKHAYFTPSDNNDETYLNVVMDYFPESLYSYNKSFREAHARMPEILVKIYSYQLLRSIYYISLLSICHRDIKPHNILVNPNHHKLQLCDFGSAKKLVKTEANISYICSRCYRAPELIFGAVNYDTQIDVWSVGCVIAELFNGEPLFLGDSAVDQLIEIIKVLGTPNKVQVLSMNSEYDMQQYKFPQIKARDWKRVIKTNDSLATDLVSKLLVYCPKTRFTPIQALGHPYFDQLRDLHQMKQLQEIYNFNIQELFEFSNLETNKMTNDEIKKLIPDWISSSSSKIVKTIG
ncbi:unnamed protein product [Paramecium octaurelia]|uniref:Protein kinase domain-containing protein n=1 Tax=Paramecium octaurelia TaxID=43137 RepID=A0A8S1UDH9_PAROT|nr:unnamed protein product [Paramecium octaurelia]